MKLRFWSGVVLSCTVQCLFYTYIYTLTFTVTIFLRHPSPITRHPHIPRISRHTLVQLGDCIVKRASGEFRTVAGTYDLSPLNPLSQEGPACYEIAH
jgi:hypothetical protein